jgi:hypothetical protein
MPLSIFRRDANRVDRREFNRIVSRSGWLRSQGSESLSGSLDSEAILQRQTSGLRTFGVMSSDIFTKPEYSSVVCVVPSGESISLTCFLDEFAEVNQRFCITLTFQWNQKYKNPADVPLIQVRKEMDKLAEWLSETSHTCGLEPIEWLA